MVQADTRTQTVGFAYDTDGARVEKTVGGVAVNYLVDRADEESTIGVLFAIFYGSRMMSS